MNSITSKLMPANSQRNILLEEFDPNSIIVKVYNYIQRKQFEKQLKAFIFRQLELEDYIEVDNSQAVPRESWIKKAEYWRKLAKKWHLCISRSVRHCSNDSGFCITIILSRKAVLPEA